MPLFVRKAHHLVLDRRAVAWAAALNRPRVHRRAPDVRANQLVRSRVGEGQMTWELRPCDAFRAKRKWRRRLIAGLHLETRVIDSAAIEARTRTGLQPPNAKAEL